ncbi:MAG: DUF2182 domain-containing protein, partial [Actinomycetes bacterium]
MRGIADVSRAERVRHHPALVVWVVAGVCWAGTGWLVLTGGHGFAHHDVVLGASSTPWVPRIGAFLAVWLVMIGAMMLPTVVPLLRLFVPVTARAPQPGRARAAFLAGYLVVWTGFAGLALLGDAGVHALVAAWPWL